MGSDRVETNTLVDFDPATDTYSNRHDWDGPAPLSYTVVETVAAVVDREVFEMEPLYSTVDPEALEAVLSSGAEDRIRVSFRYEACTVAVTSDGAVVVEPLA